MVRQSGPASVGNDLRDEREPIALALERGKIVTQQIETLFAAAQAENDALGEQLMLWFLKEQVEEVASMTTLLTIVERDNNLFDVENYVMRENIGEGDDDAPGRRRSPVERDS